MTTLFTPFLSGKQIKPFATLKSSNSIQYFILTVVMLMMSITTVFSQDIPSRPNPPRLVNDLAGVLLPEQQYELERKLVALDDSTSNQIAVVLIKTLNDYPIEDYAVKLFRSWGIGNKKTNNGVLLIAAIDDRRVKIEVGYGLEGAITDVMSKSIIENDIVPYFKEGNYFRGINIATDDLRKAAAGEYHVARQRNNNDGSGGGSFLGIIIIVIIILILVRKGGRGGRGGGMISRRGYGGIGPWIIASMLNSGNRGWGGGGGGWSGGGGFGGGGGGGGFGGFGGGSSGGGGASGSW